MRLGICVAPCEREAASGGGASLSQEKRQNNSKEDTTMFRKILLATVASLALLACFAMPAQTEAREFYGRPAVYRYHYGPGYRYYHGYAHRVPYRGWYR
jgi:hypothetical protein